MDSSTNSYQPQSFWNGSPKTMFFMGLVLGLAVSAILALTLVLSFLWSGKSFSAGSGQVAVANNQQPPSQPPAGDDVPQPPAGPVKAVSAEDHILGNKDAKVTIIEYSDFECPFCSRHLPTLKQLLKDFPKDVRLVYRHYPLSSIHPQADKAAEASECAAKVGGNDAFWKMHDKLFAQAAGAGLNPASYPDLAKEIGIDSGKFKTCLDSGEMRNRVMADAASGNDAGVTGTPANFINGQLLSGAQPYSALQAAVKAAGATQ